MAAAISRNPYAGRGVGEKALHVYFLLDIPSPETVAALDPHRSVPDTFVVHGREIFLNLPNGMARTKLTNAWFDSTLGVVCTMRNWATIARLGRLLEARAS